MSPGYSIYTLIVYDNLTRNSLFMEVVKKVH